MILTLLTVAVLWVAAAGALGVLIGKAIRIGDAAMDDDMEAAHAKSQWDVYA